MPTSLSAAHSPVISDPPAASTCDVPVASNAPGTVVTSATNLPMAATRDVPVSNNAPDTVVTFATDLPMASTHNVPVAAASDAAPAVPALETCLPPTAPSVAAREVSVSLFKKHKRLVNQSCFVSFS